MVLDSICRIRSRVTPYTFPISSSVLGCPSVSPNRIDTTPASRSDRVPSTRVQLLVQQPEADRLTGLDRLGILDQVAELEVLVTGVT